MGKSVTIREHEYGFTVSRAGNLYGHSGGASNFTDLGDALQDAHGYLKKPDMPPPGMYYVTVTRCVEGQNRSGEKYSVAELKVTSGTWKDYVFFMPLTGGFNIRVEDEHYENIVRNKVTEIHQTPGIKF